MPPQHSYAWLLPSLACGLWLVAQWQHGPDSSCLLFLPPGLPRVGAADGAMGLGLPLHLATAAAAARVVARQGELPVRAGAEEGRVAPKAARLVVGVAEPSRRGRGAAACWRAATTLQCCWWWDALIAVL